MAGHYRLGAGVHHAYAFDARYAFDHRFGHFDLDFGRRAEAQALQGAFAHRIHDGGERVALQHRPPGTHVVQVAVAIHIREPGTLRGREEHRRAADAAKRPHRRVDAAGNAVRGPFDQLLGGVSIHSVPQQSQSRCWSAAVAGGGGY